MGVNKIKQKIMETIINDKKCYKKYLLFENDKINCYLNKR